MDVSKRLLFKNVTTKIVIPMKKRTLQKVPRESDRHPLEEGDPFIFNYLKIMDSRLRGNDDQVRSRHFAANSLKNGILFFNYHTGFPPAREYRSESLANFCCGLFTYFRQRRNALKQGHNVPKSQIKIYQKNYSFRTLAIRSPRIASAVRARNIDIPFREDPALKASLQEFPGICKYARSVSAASL